MLFFCKHNWIVLSEHTSKSMADRAKQLNMGLKSRGEAAIEILTVTHIVICTCPNCGKIKKFKDTY